MFHVKHRDLFFEDSQFENGFNAKTNYNRAYQSPCLSEASHVLS